MGLRRLHSPDTWERGLFPGLGAVPSPPPRAHVLSLTALCMVSALLDTWLLSQVRFLCSGPESASLGLGGALQAGI